MGQIMDKIRTAFWDDVGMIPEETAFNKAFDKAMARAKAGKETSGAEDEVSAALGEFGNACFNYGVRVGARLLMGLGKW